ncbi:7-deoxyloganetic acid glucosyltransferase [Brachypodium distachyon]|uniref:7-deoxyloganetic acid glucosyltransferase n=1 Tax=Brachypodium distachyon TaxID=15368 RepID=UPI0001C7546E|nr:7-deoxyloganetic acid glucosyltransferase [Brachypodium distachyon]|eukprot:XP_003563101.1 7-deoxyloganetic acid glucosyltransferase [Brachypodium distachyon]
MAAAHVLVFPCPAQGHINCMLQFTAGLLAAGLHVTFLHSDHNLRRLRHANNNNNNESTAAANSSPRLRFMSVPDGLPDDHPRSAGNLVEFMESMFAKTSVAYRALLSSLRAPAPPLDANDDGLLFPPVTCVVADGMLPFAITVSEELGVPALAFRTASACSFLAYLSVPDLVALGEVPVPESADLDAPVRGVPGMEAFLRLRDLPSFCRGRSDPAGTADGLDPMLRILVDSVPQSRNARAFILNTSASLERDALSHIAPHMRDLFAVGPLHAMFQAPGAGGALWREDDACMRWLDAQADGTVVYVSLGSLAVISLEQFTEFLSGLVNAGHPFLWVLRPDMVDASQNAVLQDAVKQSKGCVVEWAPQRDVLRHRAVGCFLTHAGWNSTLECVVEGVPTVCWPFFADQQTNSRFMGAVWGTGLDMKDVCERAVVERMVREAVESGELRRSAQELAREVRRDIAEGGSSATEFRRLVEFIIELSVGVSTLETTESENE